MTDLGSATIIQHQHTLASLRAVRRLPNGGRRETRACPRCGGLARVLVRVSGNSVCTTCAPVVRREERPHAV
jgi:hypothetical protein